VGANVQVLKKRTLKKRVIKRKGLDFEMGWEGEKRKTPSLGEN